MVTEKIHFYNKRLLKMMKHLLQLRQQVQTALIKFLIKLVRYLVGRHMEWLHLELFSLSVEYHASVK